jgi:hypothetical protein
MHVASRKAEVGDKLVSSKFTNSISRGFAGKDDPNTAVCVLPGTELAFDEPVKSDNFPTDEITAVEHKTAIFRQVNTDQLHMHHDALEFPDGRTILLTRLVAGQTATVLQLPAEPKNEEEAKAQERLEVVA